jgi:hypothetical protein
MQSAIIHALLQRLTDDLEAAASTRHAAAVSAFVNGFDGGAELMQTMPLLSAAGGVCRVERMPPGVAMSGSTVAFANTNGGAVKAKL